MEAPEQRQRLAISFISPGYFETLGIPLLAGRDFSLPDIERPRVAIVSAAVARHFFTSVNPIGRHSQLSTTRNHSGSVTISLMKLSVWPATSNRSTRTTLHTLPSTSTCFRRTTFSTSLSSVPAAIRRQ